MLGGSKAEGEDFQSVMGEKWCGADVGKRKSERFLKEKKRKKGLEKKKKNPKKRHYSRKKLKA